MAEVQQGNRYTNEEIAFVFDLWGADHLDPEAGEVAVADLPSADLMREYLGNDVALDTFEVARELAKKELEGQVEPSDDILTSFLNRVEDTDTPLVSPDTVDAKTANSQLAFVFLGILITETARRRDAINKRSIAELAAERNKQ